MKRGDGMPVQCVAVVQTFPTLSAAADHYGVAKQSLHAALTRGRRCCGVWWRFANVPPEHQPLKDARERPVVREDGSKFVSMTMAVRTILGSGIDRREEKREQMKLVRAIRRNRPYRGQRYWFAAEDELKAGGPFSKLLLSRTG